MTCTPEFGQVLVGTMIVGSPVGWTFPGVFCPCWPPGWMVSEHETPTTARIARHERARDAGERVPKGKDVNRRSIARAVS
jgi:hypothetical protein